ncbi:MAG TPA: protein kinase [Nitrospiria bacterium]|nr:protein kinase [Nitrospiria bacterium]
MNYLHDLLNRFLGWVDRLLAENPELRAMLHDFLEQASLYWSQIEKNTPLIYKQALVGLAAALFSLVFFRKFLDSNFLGWVLKILPRSLMRSTLIKRAERFAKSLEYITAGEIYEAIQEYPRAVAMYVKANNFKRSGDLYARVGKFREAARVYEEGKLYLEASKYYEQEAVFLKAGEMFERLPDYYRAGMNYAKHVAELEKETPGDETSRKIQDIAGKAGNLLMKVKEYSAAGPLLEKAGLFEEAASAFKKAKKSLSVAHSLEEAKKFTEAGKIYEEAGELEKAASCFEKGENYFRAGEIIKRLGQSDRAISLFQKVDTESKDYDQASFFLGNLFQQKGMVGPAREKYLKLIERKGVTRESIEVYYNLAVLTEEMGDFHEAVSMYEKIQAEELNYKDVVSRLEAAKEKAAKASEMTPEETEAHTVTSRYKMLNELGRGGMGIVYRAEDTVLKRIVAYKILPDAFKNNPQFLESFMLEARTAAALNHPNIVTIFDTGRIASNYYITMEYIDGITLKDLLGKGKGPVEIAIVLPIARQLCLGLGYAHEKNVVHRDIKPANLMLTRDKIVKIMDFGLAKLVSEGISEKTTVKGTPYYMSPEQIVGNQVDVQTDIYALGCTLYHLMAGRPPFIEGDIYYHHLHSVPDSPRKYNNRIPEPIAEVILKSIEKKKEARYRKPVEILEDLEKCMAGAAKAQ